MSQAVITDYLNLGSNLKPDYISGAHHICIFRIDRPNGPVFLNMWGETHTSGNHCDPCDPDVNNCWSINRIVENGVEPALVLVEYTMLPEIDTAFDTEEKKWVSTGGRRKGDRKKMSTIGRVVCRSDLASGYNTALRHCTTPNERTKIVETDLRITPFRHMLPGDKMARFVEDFPYFKVLLEHENFYNASQSDRAMIELWQSVRLHFNFAQNECDVWLPLDILDMFVMLTESVFPNISTSVIRNTLVQLMQDYGPNRFPFYEFQFTQRWLHDVVICLCDIAVILSIPGIVEDGSQNTYKYVHIFVGEYHSTHIARYLKTLSNVTTLFEFHNDDLQCFSVTASKFVKTKKRPNYWIDENVMFYPKKRVTVDIL